MVAVNAVVDLTIEGEIGVLALDSPPVNALSHALREGIFNGIQQAIGNDAVKAIVLICRGRTFVAGADITEFGKPMKLPDFKAVLEMIEASPKPVIAALHGTALGGGLELALSCHYRVSVPSARGGLPEVHLGIIPGAGGTQRLPRIVGPQLALEMITSGAHVEAARLHQEGLLDEIVAEGELLKGALAFAGRVIAEKMPLKKVRDLDHKLAKVRGRPDFFADFRKANARRFRGLMAVEYGIRAVEAAVDRPFDEGLAFESQLFEELLRSDQSAALRYVFFAERQAGKIPDIAADTALIPIAKVGVIGAGTMGGGISMSFANAGIPVTLVEVKQEALERGLGVIRRNYESSAKRGRLTAQDVEQRMSLLNGSLDMRDLADCDLVIEAVFEDMDLKKSVFAKLDGIVKQGAILATNTSYLDVNEIAATTRRPEYVIGLHFFSPANIMRLLEIVRGTATSKPVVATSMKLARKLGKIAVLVGVCRGFVGNRILAARQAQANAMLMEGAMPWDIDKVLYDFGMPMGPFAMTDLAGLDIGWKKATSNSASIRDALCEMNRLGQKTGAGFYDYDDKRNASPSAVTAKLVNDFLARSGVTPRRISEQEILERCTYTMINEGAKILEEKIAIRASDIDIVWINGYGWPAYRGGPMFHADMLGPALIVEKLKELAPRLGSDFSISPLLEELAASGRRFQDLQ